MPKVTIRPQRVSDAKAFFDILHNHNFDYFEANPKTVEEERKFLQSNVKKRKENIEYNFSILYGEKLVGGCGIKINQHRKHIGEIGYFIAEKYWGKGITVKAVKLLEKYGFGKLRLSRIQILMHVKNKPSRRVAEKCGYLREGRMRKAIEVNGEKCDFYLYAKVK